MSISSLVPANEMPRNIAGSIPVRVHLPQLLLVRFRRRGVEVGAQPPLLGAREAERLLKNFMLIWAMTSQSFSDCIFITWKVICNCCVEIMR